MKTKLVVIFLMLTFNYVFSQNFINSYKTDYSSIITNVKTTQDFSDIFDTNNDQPILDTLKTSDGVHYYMVGSTEGPDKNVELFLSSGLFFSSEYKKFMEDMFSSYDVSGLGMWYSIDGGVTFKIVNNLYVGAELRFLFTTMQIKTYYIGGYSSSSSDEVYFNTILVPALKAKYYLANWGSGAISLGGSVGPLMINADSEFGFEFESNGLAAKAAAAFELRPSESFGGGIELGYSSHPVKIKDTFYSGYYSYTYEEEKNFSGVNINVYFYLAL